MKPKFGIYVSLFLTGLASHALGQETIRVTREDCSRLVAHRPAAGVDYQPGVDAYGRPVVPPDLEESRIQLPESIAIVITVEIQERFGIPANSVLYKPEAFIGVADFEFADQSVSFNGVPLTDPEQAALAAACSQTR
jgi:hypothetical protein